MDRYANFSPVVSDSNQIKENEMNLDLFRQKKLQWEAAAGTSGLAFGSGYRTGDMF